MTLFQSWLHSVGVHSEARGVGIVVALGEVEVNHQLSLNTQ